MQTSNDSLILGIDHGYGNIKTANKTFGTGVYVSDTEPAFKDNLLTWNGKYYTIGEGHKEFVADKIQDMDYYVLTLAAVAYELRARGLREAKVHLAAGLPLTWLTAQKEAFRSYLLQNKEVEFSFNGIDYRVEFTGADIFPQGFAAIADRIHEFSGTNMLCDIGNGTMNVMLINEKKPENRRCFTEKFGTQQCVIQAKEDMMRTHHATVDESVITRVLRFGKADIADEFLETITKSAKNYVAEIFRNLREHGYDPRMMRLTVVGGGGCLIKNFADCDKSRITVIDDIRATAKGYERLATRQRKRSDNK